MEKYCNECGKTIPEKVYYYSKEHFSRPLCMKHQPHKLAKKSYKKRHKPTPETLKLGNLLKKMGHKVEFEKYDGYKHIDIVIAKSKVNIEVDGSHHQRTEQALRDLKRTFYSWNKNFVTLRIPNSLTKENTIKETAEYIDKFLRKNKAQLKREVKEEHAEEDNPKEANGIISRVINIFRKSIMS